MAHFTATPGYILTQPYLPKDKPFQQKRAAVGEAQLSTVIVVGGDVIDDQGITRKAPCAVGDIIVHAYNAKDFTDDFTLCRYVHFTEVYGVKEEDATE